MENKKTNRKLPDSLMPTLYAHYVEFGLSYQQCADWLFRVHGIKMSWQGISERIKRFERS
jgi:hypothetical protein